MRQFLTAILGLAFTITNLYPSEELPFKPLTPGRNLVLNPIDCKTALIAVGAESLNEAKNSCPVCGTLLSLSLSQASPCAALCYRGCGSCIVSARHPDEQIRIQVGDEFRILNAIPHPKTLFDDNELLDTRSESVEVSATHWAEGEFFDFVSGKKTSGQFLMLGLRISDGLPQSWQAVVLPMLSDEQRAQLKNEWASQRARIVTAMVGNPSAILSYPKQTSVEDARPLIILTFSVDSIPQADYLFKAVRNGKTISWDLIQEAREFKWEESGEGPQFGYLLPPAPKNLPPSQR